MNSELKKMGNLNREIREKRGTNNHAEEVFPQLRRSDVYVESPSPKISLKRRRCGLFRAMT
jgi:hypothetical protein